MQTLLQAPGKDPTLPKNPFTYDKTISLTDEEANLYLWKEKLQYFIDDPWFSSVLLIGVLLVFTYYVIVNRIGRHKPLGSYTPTISPPYSMSPAAVRFLMKKGFDTKCLVVGVVNAAIKGCYRIRWAKKGFLVLRTENPDFERLSNDEKSALTFRKNNYWEKVFVSTTFSLQTNKMSGRMGKYLGNRYGKLIRKRVGFVIGGALASTLILFVAFSLAEGRDLMMRFLAFYLVAWLGILVPLFFLRLSLRDKYWMGLATCLLYLTVGMVGIYLIEKYTFGPLMSPTLIPFVLINVLFYPLMPTYTIRGAKVMDEVLAYRRYLTEKFAAQQVEREMEEGSIRELPYVIAMDIDYAHTGFFKDILSETKYAPYQVFDHIYR